MRAGGGVAVCPSGCAPERMPSWRLTGPARCLQGGAWRLSLFSMPALVAYTRASSFAFVCVCARVRACPCALSVSVCVHVHVHSHSTQRVAATTTRQVGMIEIDSCR